jgi:hypothetical protein
MHEFLVESKIKNFIVAESDNKHRLGKPLVKALNEFIDRQLVAIIDGDFLPATPKPQTKTKPDLPFLHLNRVKLRLKELSQDKFRVTKQLSIDLNNLILSVLLSTIKSTEKCTLNTPILLTPDKIVTPTIQAPKEQFDLQRQIQTLNVKIKFNSGEVTGSTRFFSGLHFAKLEATIRERIFKGLLDSGISKSELENLLQIEVSVVDKK